MGNTHQLTQTHTHTHAQHAHTHSNLCIKISHCALLVEHFWLFWFSLPLAIRSFLLLLLICCCACAVHLGCRCHCCCCCFCCCRLPHAAGNKMAPCPAPDMCPQAKSLQHSPALLSLLISYSLTLPASVAGIAGRSHISLWKKLLLIWRKFN